VPDMSRDKAREGPQYMSMRDEQGDARPVPTRSAATARGVESVRSSLRLRCMLRAMRPTEAGAPGYVGLLYSGQRVDVNELPSCVKCLHASDVSCLSD